MKFIKNLHNLKGKEVLLRVDFNVPYEKHKILDDFKIRASLPTIEYLIKEKARIIILSHFEEGASLKPVASRAQKLLGHKILFLNACLGRKVETAVKRLKDTEIVMLENVRTDSREGKNDAQFARELAALADIYVNDAFGVSHRVHASVVGVARYLPSYAGLLLAREVEALTRILKNPQKPLVVLMGGAKVSTKLGMIKNFLKTASQVLVGGGIANTIFKAKGYEIGKSILDVAMLKEAAKLALESKIVLPGDVVVARGKNIKTAMVKGPKEIQDKEAIFDIGPGTIREFSSYIRKAQTIIWNGPMGYFEVPTFSHGSVALGRLIASRSKGKAFGVVGGGETLVCLQKTGMAEFVDHISTGGGAMLEFLAGEKLPGIEALG